MRIEVTTYNKLFLDVKNIDYISNFFDDEYILDEEVDIKRFVIFKKRYLLHSISTKYYNVFDFEKGKIVSLKKHRIKLFKLFNQVKYTNTLIFKNAIYETSPFGNLILNINDYKLLFYKDRFDILYKHNYNYYYETEIKYGTVIIK